MLAPEQLSLLTKYLTLTQCHLDLITLCLLQTRTPSCQAEIGLISIPAGSTGTNREQVPLVRSPGIHDSPHNSICFPPLTAGKDAAAKCLGQHSRLLQSSQAVSTRHTRSQRYTAPFSKAPQPMHH